MKFYKEAATGLWRVGNNILPAGSCQLAISDADGLIDIVTVESQSTIASGFKFSDFTDEAGNPYESLEAMLLAVKSFFFRLRDLRTNSIELIAESESDVPLVVRNMAGEIVAYTDANGFHEIRYRDEYASGRWTDAPGAAAPDVVNVTFGGVGTQMFGFDGNNTEERLSNHFEIPHDMPADAVNAGTLKVEVHHHVRPSTNNAGVCKLFFDWSYTPPFGAPIAMASVPVLVTVNANRQHWQLLAGAELPVPTGGYILGGIITFNTRRTPTDPQDTYPDDMLFIKTALHVPTDGGAGSRQRYEK